MEEKIEIMERLANIGKKQEQINVEITKLHKKIDDLIDGDEQINILDELFGLNDK